jgi:hypothetical protein
MRLFQDLKGIHLVVTSAAIALTLIRRGRNPDS